MTIYKCDRCGKTRDAIYLPTITANDRSYYVTFNQPMSRRTDYPIYLCEDCCKALESWWMGGLK